MPSKQFLLLHDEISVREGLERLLNGLEVTNPYGRIYKLADKDSLTLLVRNPHSPTNPRLWEKMLSTLLDITQDKFYVPKPFDLRKALLEKPNEIVAEFDYQHPDTKDRIAGYLFFDTKKMRVCSTKYPDVESEHVCLYNYEFAFLLDKAFPYLKEEDSCSS